MKIALIQQKASRNKSENIEKALESFDEAVKNGAKIIAFSELAFERFHPQRRKEDVDIRTLAETVPGPVTEAFSKRCRDSGVVAVLNLYEEDNGKCYDSSPVIGTDGMILGKTRMIHITDYEGFHEKDYYHPGDLGIPVYDTEFGKISVCICYDRHYPEYMRAMAVKGAEIVFIPQAGVDGEWPEGLYEAELRVASFQNGYFTALCNRVGEEEVLAFSGESFVTDPAGNVIARAGKGTEEILYVDLDMEMPKRSHARELFLRDRRKELYHGWI